MKVSCPRQSLRLLLRQTLLAWFLAPDNLQKGYERRAQMDRHPLGFAGRFKVLKLASKTEPAPTKVVARRDKRRERSVACFNGECLE